MYYCHSRRSKQIRHSFTILITFQNIYWISDAKKPTMARTLTKRQPEGSSVSIRDIRTLFAWLACMVIGSIPLCLFYRITGKPTPCELIAACRHFCQVKCNLYATDNRGKLWQPWAVSLSVCCQITVMTVELALVSNLNLKPKYIKYLQLNIHFSFRKLRFFSSLY